MLKADEIKPFGCLSTQELEKIEHIKTRYDSDTVSNYRLPSTERKHQESKGDEVDDETLDLPCSPKSQSNQFISNSSEVMSFKSDEKEILRVKDTTQTNPTSETSSLKCSSVASHQESKNQDTVPPMMKNQSQNYSQAGEWITSANKKRSTKAKKNSKATKTNKKGKQNKPKAKPGKKGKQAEDLEDFDKKPDSIWAENIEQTILIAESPILQKCKTQEPESVLVKTTEVVSEISKDKKQKSLGTQSFAYLLV